VTAIARDGAGLRVETADGRSRSAPVVAVALPADQAARALRDGFHELSDAVAKVRTVEVESAGVVLPRARCWMPEIAFLVPVDDLFHSAVTRDPFPHPELRSFAFHFRPGLSREARLRRMAEVLRVPEGELGEVVEARATLPAPGLGHGELLAEMDRCLSGGKLALLGNYFDGMAIEDCMLRSAREWARVAG
jgi:protoporphyrinogen/coproporphyrinogen III oxidase